MPEPRCHACVRNEGRFFDERKKVWWCSPCLRLAIDVGISTAQASRYDRFMKALRPKADA